MSDGEPGGMTDPPPVVRLEACLLAETAHAFLELLSDIAVGANNPQQSWGFDGEPPEAVMKDAGTRDWTLCYEEPSFSCSWSSC
jgi:hypothetical protein